MSNRYLSGEAILCAGGLAATLGCQPSAAGRCSTEANTRAAIVGGTSEATFLSLAPEQVSAIGRTEPGDDEPRCSVTLVASGYALTAAHCASNTTLNVVLAGTPATASVAEVDSSRDLALLVVESVDATPIPILQEPLGGAWVGELVLIAGLGMNQEGEFPSTASFAVERIGEVADATVTVEGKGKSGACAGDSGGPLLVRDAEGRARLAGVLSFGSAGCLGSDTYAQAFTMSAFTGDDEAAAGCDGLTALGICRQQTAMFCDGEVVHADLCGAGAVCGWSSLEEGFRCVAPVDDPCQDVGDTGKCLGTTAVTCSQGELETADCGVCGSCGYSAQSGHPECVR